MVLMNGEKFRNTEKLPNHCDFTMYTNTVRATYAEVVVAQGICLQIHKKTLKSEIST
jgi:hypothetical protein